MPSSRYLRNSQVHKRRRLGCKWSFSLCAASGKWSKIIWYTNSFTRLTCPHAIPFKIWDSNLYIFNTKSDVFARLWFVEICSVKQDLRMQQLEIWGHVCPQVGSRFNWKHQDWFLFTKPATMQVRNILSCCDEAWKFLDWLARPRLRLKGLQIF